MMATFAAQPFLWQAAIVAVLTAVAALVILAILSGLPRDLWHGLQAWLDDPDQAIRRRANVEPIDPGIERALLAAWVRLGDSQQVERVVPLKETRNLEVEIHW